jgi:tRNA U55 pseudouridine synthase TruB
MNNILNISKEENLSSEEIISHLKKFWNESIRKEYIDMRVNKRRFDDFRTKVGG